MKKTLNVRNLESKISGFLLCWFASKSGGLKEKKPFKVLTFKCNFVLVIFLKTMATLSLPPFQLITPVLPTFFISLSLFLQNICPLFSSLTAHV